MSELARLAQPLVDRPFVVAPSRERLQQRNRARHRRHLVGGSAGMAVVLVVSLVVVLMPSSSTPAPSPAPRMSLATFIHTGVSVPDSVLESVGLPARVAPPSTLGGHQPVLGHGPKVNVVYVGAEFCPYCAVERWALVVALSRFGSFSNLGHIVTSSSTDVWPGLQSWSFEGSGFSSQSVAFHPAEIYSSTPTRDVPGGRCTTLQGVPTLCDSHGYEPLQRLTPVEKGAFNAYDNDALPFIDIGDRYIAIGASADPAPLEGLSLDQIAADLSQPSTPVAQAIDGSANYLIAALCAETGRGNPPICSASFVTSAQARMAATPWSQGPGA
jgi:hypothetical protein